MIGRKQNLIIEYNQQKWSSPYFNLSLYLLYGKNKNSCYIIKPLFLINQGFI